MPKREEAYAFRKDYCRPHKRIHGAKQRIPNADELVLTDGLTISVGTLGQVAKLAAKDFAAYLKTAFGLNAKVVDGKADITACVDPDALNECKGYMGRKTCVVAQGITIAAFDERGVAQAFYALEDRMNLRRAPFLTHGTTEQMAAFSPRMIHSGVGLDYYPDEYLSTCAHYGYDAILAFVENGTKGAHGVEYDFRDLCRRAAKYGIDVYAYSYLTNYVHPDEEGAWEQYDAVFGQVFRDVPEFKGIVFVGESANFPSRDPRVIASEDLSTTSNGLPTGKPNPGWFPCCDYPDWLRLSRDVIRAVKPDADIIFWTYNFANASVEERVAFVEAMPTDVSLQVNFNIPHTFQFDNAPSKIRDYTVSRTKPSIPFLAEAEVAKRRGIRLYSMVNTAGRTWDFGVVSYEPFPWQWNDLHQEILKAREKYGLCGLMESHHFGFTPSFISRQAKQAYTVGGMRFADYLDAWADRLAGADKEKLLSAMKLVDESIHYYTPSNENQYGPYRIGPAFPFNVLGNTHRPDPPGVHFGYEICFVQNYHDDGSQAAPYSLRRPDEIARSKKARSLIQDGLRIMKTISVKGEELKKLMNMLEYMCCTHRTAINFKELTILREKMQLESNPDRLYRLTVQVENLLKRERKNAEAAIPMVERDSALGFEPSMDYIGGADAIRWKLQHLDVMLEKSLPVLRRR
ncbi:MAG: hypothetical protein E7450_05150 [Ruminococcaceae bacterium]|nr:hypothetical protein [Oscillospiraceae bacterium]